MGLGKTKVQFFISILLVFTTVFFEPIQINAQANLVEENDQFVIYSGNYFEMIIPKDEGPTAIFDIHDFGKIRFELNYLSEYLSTSVFMHSVNNLFGKGYSLNEMEWDSVGSAETKKTYVNFTRSYLESNATLQASYNIFNQPINISGFEIPALAQALVEFRIKDWEFSPDSKGIALNLITYQEESEDYTRFGPYLDIPTLTYIVKIIANSGSEFFIQFKPNITIITKTGETEEYESMFFANYNVAAYDSEPADIWISTPKHSNIKEIIFSFRCYYTIAPTSNSAIEPVVSFAIAFITISIMANVLKLRRRKK